MNNSNLCRVDCYGILKSLIDKGLTKEELYLSFREQYLQNKPGCFCDYILRDLIAEGKTGEDLLKAFQEKQDLVAKGYELVYGKENI
ncbi:MAG: hypothetical protein ACOX1Y_09860 [Zhaonellaceae bacterium]|jgi:hypothetical protein|nr:hypothetical protein [Clostridia bacterium]